MQKSVGHECQPLLDTDLISGLYHAAFGISESDSGRMRLLYFTDFQTHILC